MLHLTNLFQLIIYSRVGSKKYHSLNFNERINETLYVLLKVYIIFLHFTE